MEFKFDSSTNKGIKKSSEIPEHLKWILHSGYRASYAEGSFGKMVIQIKTEGDYELRLYYIEVWKPVDFYVISEKRFNTIYASFAHDVLLNLSNGQFPLVVREGGIQVASIAEYPTRHIIAMKEQGYYVSWHLNAPLKYEKQFRNSDFINQLLNRFQPSIDFKKASRFPLRVPLAV